MWLLLITLFTFISNVDAVKVRTLEWTVQWDAANKTTATEGNYDIFGLIKVINSYLWFGIWVVCFIFMIINGYKLITAHWDEKQTKAATSALFKSIIWIAICLLSYIIVNLAVKIFA